MRLSIQDAHLRFFAQSTAEIGHKRFGRCAAKKPQKSVTFGDRTFWAEVRVKRDKSRSETDFGVLGSLWGSVAIGKTARKLGIFWPREAHLIDSH